MENWGNFRGANPAHSEGIMPNAIQQVEHAIRLAERIAAGKVKISTIRKMKPLTAMMVLLWFRYEMPDGINALDFEVSETLFERTQAGR